MKRPFLLMKMPRGLEELGSMADTARCISPVRVHSHQWSMTQTLDQPSTKLSFKPWGLIALGLCSFANVDAQVLGEGRNL